MEILAIEMATDLPSTFDSSDCMRLVKRLAFVLCSERNVPHRVLDSFVQVGYDMSKRAAQQAYAKAGVKPSDVQVVELHGESRERRGGDEPFSHSMTFENELERARGREKVTEVRVYLLR